MVIAIVCGTCRVHRAAEVVPDRCACGARFGRDGYAVIEAEIAVEGARVRSDIAARFHGSWSAEERAALVAAIEQDAQGRTPDAGEET